LTPAGQLGNRDVGNADKTFLEWSNCGCLERLEIGVPYGFLEYHVEFWNFWSRFKSTRFFDDGSGKIGREIGSGIIMNDYVSIYIIRNKKLREIKI